MGLTGIKYMEQISHRSWIRLVNCTRRRSSTNRYTRGSRQEDVIRCTTFEDESHTPTCTATDEMKLFDIACGRPTSLGSGRLLRIWNEWTTGQVTRADLTREPEFQGKEKEFCDGFSYQSFPTREGVTYIDQQCRDKVMRSGSPRQVTFSGAGPFRSQQSVSNISHFQTITPRPWPSLSHLRLAAWCESVNPHFLFGCDFLPDHFRLRRCLPREPTSPLVPSLL